MSVGLRVYSYSACSTCRKALRWLGEQGLDAEVIDITLQPPSLQELRQAFKQLEHRRLFNTSGISYRALGSAVVTAMDDDAALAALAADGKLIKRPFLISANGTVLTGFDPQQWQALLLPSAATQAP
ncbi:Spx/MgsR family RNA polymerase-binding regulatory protein [Synechococcus sp. ATX 2A4]|uniref:Spx/MgsR family RNA polymerase-binding regulatory protein n=1 Tax=Synechococcus sp. ATX 2A4 TaxID=2823727 RepID=UPI0020CD12F8|nr:Spx/MgsR family RNA polymerase-binding regulatory protein [Synechococcus sp. ATX 2A4]MCP9883939.1 Spx/MgsR family RNA polymerase-binding regulatory protein [Synechococcus sp. ATX 2A4]